MWVFKASVKHVSAQRCLCVQRNVSVPEKKTSLGGAAGYKVQKAKSDKNLESSPWSFAGS